MFPHGLTLQATWTCGERRTSSRTATIAWTRVHAISKSSTRVKCYLSKAIGWLTWRHVATREASDLLQKWITQDRDRTVHSPKDQSDGPDTSWKNSTIAARSNRDRAAIGERKWWHHLYDERMAIDERPGPRSWPDCGWNACYSEAKLTLIHGGIEATTSPQGTAPTKPWINLHDRFNWPRSSGQFHSLKPMYLSLWNSTFDRLVKKLSEFRGRSLVHRDPPAFRLDCEAIGAGLITNFFLISSNFPLEFRTSTRKNPSKFASIHENWSPVLAAIGLVVRFYRLSGGN